MRCTRLTHTRCTRATPTVVLSGAVLLVAVGGVGGAVAAGQIGSTDIKDHSVRQVDLAKNSVTARQLARNAVRSAELKNGGVRPGDLSAAVQELIATAVTGPAGPAGPEGPPGPAGGPAGPAGADGVSGHEVVTKQQTFSGNGTQTLTVACPEGKTALAGGLRSDTPLLMTTSAPSAGASSWTVGFVRNKTRGGGSYQVTVVATCATVL